MEFTGLPVISGLRREKIPVARVGEAGPDMPDDAYGQHHTFPKLDENPRHQSNKEIVRADDLDFDLPPDLIAQTPPAQRSAARLLHYQKSSSAISHRTFADFPDLLREDDVLVFNDALVLPARFTLRKNTGGRVEGLFLSEKSPGHWKVLLRNLGRLSRDNLIFEGDPKLQAKVIAVEEGGQCDLEISTSAGAREILSRIGRMPLPPYIKRDKESDPRDEQDHERYQTIYAASPGSVAAPTAGLHFTPEILAQLDAKGIQRTVVTLNVGLGTFKPVTAQTLQDHVMHVESYSISAAAANMLNLAAKENRRIVAIGTTTARVLESWPQNESWRDTIGETSIFIYPPYRWKRVGALVTNFHLPRSTLIALVAAFVGLTEQRKLYQTAIEQRYRFFSYGDAMFLE